MAARSLTETIADLRRGRTTSVALAEAAIERHERYGAALNAYRTFDADLARGAARHADAAFAAGRDLGPLQGIPVSVKDLFGVAGWPTYAGTARRLPEKWEAEGPVVRRLKAQSAVIVGKTHTVEFAIGGLGGNAHYGMPRNPWDAGTARACGGSSSGAGVSLHEGSAFVAVGSDTSGSVRMPASMTGTVGWMASHGRWSTEGIVPVAPILDAPGLLTRSVADLVPAFLSLDAASWNLAGRTLADVRIGIVRTLLWDDCAPGIAEGVDAALRELEAAGAILVDVELPHLHAVFALFQQGHLAAAAAYSLIRTEFPEWWEEMDVNVRSRLEALGAMLPAHEYVARMRTIEGWMKAADRCFEFVDAIACPTVAISPPRATEIAAPEDYRRANMAGSRNSAVLALLGACALSMPVALDRENMPVGLQLAGRHGGDPALIALALACERILGTPDRRLGSPPFLSNDGK